MDCRTGRIYEADTQEAMAEIASKFEQENNRQMVELSADEAERLMPETPAKRKNWMRNKSCPCGSGKKFKRCCWSVFA